MRKVFLTGATGVMGMAGMRAILNHNKSGESVSLTILARRGKVNERKLAPYIRSGVKVIWGDLNNPADIEAGIMDADIVLHVGGLVSPAADWMPEKTMKVNIGAMENIIEAARKKENAGGEVAVVYIGSVSQYGNRCSPYHWGRTGDPIKVAAFDKYALSKSIAERMLAESGLKRWVSLRQTGIMHPALLQKASDPISFHVPMRECLEWVTDIESGELLASLCNSNLKESFWRRFYNIGGGESARLSNYEFMKLTLKAVGCPPPEKSFRLNWFATGNFHGVWYEDSDDLESLLHFRSKGGFPQYVGELIKRMPFYFRLAPLAPAFIIRAIMKRVALTPELGTLWWIKENKVARIDAAWGSISKWEEIPDWKDADMSPLSQERRCLDHGYDESKPLSTLTIADMQRAAEFRGGKCRSTDMKRGEIDSQLEWECSEGHIFQLTPRTVLLGGHWCDHCLREMSDDPHAVSRQGERNKFLRQTL